MLVKTLRRIKKLLPLLFLFYLQTGFAKTDPTFSWMTLSSPHFLIHCHQGEEALAKRAMRGMTHSTART